MSNLSRMEDKINFLQINASDIKWGASLAGFRLHQGFLAKGYNSHILCALKEYSGSDSSSILPGKFSYLPNALAGKFFNALGLQAFGYPSAFFLKRSSWVNEWAEVIILRNLHWWYFSLAVLPHLAQKAPLIWRLPDMWALTGHCAYSYECAKWKEGCGKCPRLFDYPELYIDTTHFLWIRKKKIYQKLNDRLIFVTPSQWLKQIVQESPLTGGFRCELIPTAVDLRIFKPGLKTEARNILGIGETEKVIMFSAFKLSDARKGSQDAITAINALKRKTDIPLTVLAAGYRGEELKFRPGIKTVKAGFTQDEKFLAGCYNASNVYLSLSRADNLPNTLVEASACGVPIVTLDSGGCREALIEAETGFRVKDIAEAVEALDNILSDSLKQEAFSKKAVAFAQSRFSMDSQVEAYVALARDLIHRRKRAGPGVKDNRSNTRYLSGVRIDYTTYEAAVGRIMDLAGKQRGSFVCIENADVLTRAARDPDFKQVINSAALNTPDGMPLVWALKLFGVKEAQKVSGPDLTPLICERAQELEVAVGFYGGSRPTLDLLLKKLSQRFPALNIAYAFSPPFRPLSAEEDEKITSDIVNSGAKIIFVGIGSPKQEIWAAEHKDKLPAVLVTVGAAFDFIAGTLPRAPRWMQDWGLEWLFRLAQEPKRLWKRYLVGNAVFIYLLCRQLIKNNAGRPTSRIL